MFESDGETMLPVDNDIRENILNAHGNVVISASAGTGKTYTTIQRIIKDTKDCADYKTFAAITFTRKASKEIMNRLGPNKANGFIGTNDNFILVEVIQAFMHDAFGVDFKIEIKPDFNDDNRVKNFDAGVEKIRKTHLMCKYTNIRKNFAFQLALEILQRSHVARRYLKSKYYRIYIDEYQDSDVDMHVFFMFLADELLIPLFIVGDSKQSIYGWRGAYSNGFTSLFKKSSFSKYELWHNFRSNKVIQNYSNIFMESVREHYQITEFNEEIIACKYNEDNEAVAYIKEWIDPNKKCAFLNFSNGNAEYWSEKLQIASVPFVYIPGSPLDHSSIESEHIWIARGIASYTLQQRYSEYNFMDEIPMPEAYSLLVIKKLLKSIVEVQYNAKLYEQYCLKLYDYLNYYKDLEKIKREVAILLAVVNDNKYIPTYNQSRYKLTSGTIHSSKGLEFEQVIINAGDYNLSREGIIFLHYVAISRPEERLLIIGRNRTMDRYINEVEKVMQKTRELGYKIEFENVMKVVDSRKLLQV